MELGGQRCLHLDAKVPGIIGTYQPVLKSWRTAKIVHQMSNDESSKAVNEAVGEGWPSKEVLYSEDGGTMV